MNMKTREELEKIYEDMYDRLSYEDFKSYVFENIIPEVLKSIMPGEDINTAYFFTKDGVKQKAKEHFNINL